MADGIQDLLKAFGLSDTSLERVKLSRGIVGRTTYAVVAALVVLAVVASRADAGALLWIGLLAVVAFAIYFVGVLWFANKNPGVAILEGAELVHWRQIELAAKGIGQIPPAPVVQAPTELPRGEGDGSSTEETQ